MCVYMDIFSTFFINRYVHDIHVLQTYFTSKRYPYCNVFFTIISAVNNISLLLIISLHATQFHLSMILHSIYDIQSHFVDLDADIHFPRKRVPQVHSYACNTYTLCVRNISVSYLLKDRISLTHN